MHMMDTPLVLTSFLNRAERFFHAKKNIFPDKPYYYS